MADHVLLVSANEMRPPVAPIALDYLACALRTAGRDTALCDLAWEADPNAALAAALSSSAPVAVA